jgi:hypothetical protein
MVMQPVIKSRTAIYGKGFSGGALNRVQKPVQMHKKSSPSSGKSVKQECRYPFGF